MVFSGCHFSPSLRTLFHAQLTVFDQISIIVLIRFMVWSNSLWNQKPLISRQATFLSVIETIDMTRLWQIPNLYLMMEDTTFSVLWFVKAKFFISIPRKYSIMKDKDTLSSTTCSNILKMLKLSCWYLWQKQQM